MELNYQTERDKDFFETCETVRKSLKPKYISGNEIVKIAVLKEAKSFYLDTKSISHIINKARIGCMTKIKSEATRDLYIEIWIRYIHIKRKNPNLNSMDIARIIEKQPAPKFYISIKHALNLYYKLLKKNPK